VGPPGGPAYPAPVPWATNGEVRLWWERAGEGSPVLFAGGTGGDLRRRPNVLDGPLAGRFDVLTYDQRGQGRSTGPDRPYTMADYVDDAVTVLDAVGWARCSVVGASFGGMVAQELAIRHPDRVDRLVLVCTSSGGAGRASYPVHELADLPEDERPAAFLAAADTRFDRSWQEAHPDEAADLLAHFAAVGGALSRRQLEARRQHDAYDRLGRIAAPTLVAAGRYDGIAPVANGRAIADRIPDARLEVFEGGHLFLAQDPAAYEAIVAFLGG
jgi:3-oxoadipate enol-lactonase